MNFKFYAIYGNTNDALVFGSRAERDTYVSDESILYPDCRKISAEKAQSIIGDKTPVYNDSLGCMAVLH